MPVLTSFECFRHTSCHFHPFQSIGALSSLRTLTHTHTHTTDDDEFLNWGNINLGCTARCAVYWRCVYANFQDPAAQVSCDKPSGCQCDKFADDDDERFVLPYRPSPTFPTFPRPIMYDDDEKINWKKLGKNVKKGIEIYKQAKEIRDMLRSDDDDERYNPIRFPTSSTGPYNPTPTFPRFDDDEKINWKKIGGKVRRGVELYRKYKDLLRPTGDSDDDLKFKIGKLLKKAPRLMSKASDLYKNYQSIRSQANFDDDLDERRMRDTLTKAKKYYRKGRNAYRAIRKLRRALKEKKDAIAAPAVEEVVEEEDDVKTKTSALLKRGLQLYRQIKSNDEAQG